MKNLLLIAAVLSISVTASVNARADFDGNDFKDEGQKSCSLENIRNCISSECDQPNPTSEDIQRCRAYCRKIND